MKTQWIAPQIVEFSLEDLSKYVELQVACAGTYAGGAGQDHG